MRFALCTLGLGAIGAVAGAVYGGITWHDTCSGPLQIGCQPREESMIVHGFVGLLYGAVVGLMVWFACRAFEELRVAREERLAKGKNRSGQR